MQIITPQGTTFPPGLVLDVATGNLVWVDQVNGNDDAALRGRLASPFLTLTAAKEAAESGDTIVVLPGTYNEDTLFKDGVNWHFMNGAKVIGLVSSQHLFSVETAAISRITGFGEFEAASSACVLAVNDPDADIFFFRAEFEGRYLGVSCVRVQNSAA